MRVLAWLVFKDLKVWASDRSGAILSVVIPIAMAAFLGALFGGSSDDAGEITVLIADADGGERVAALVSALDATTAVKVERVAEAEARERVARGRASTALIIPAGSGVHLRPASLFADAAGRVELVHDPSAGIEASIVEGLLQKVQLEVVARGLSEPRALGDMLDDLRRSLLADGEPAAGGVMAGWLRVLDDAAGLTKRQVADESTGEPAAAGASLRPPLTITKTALTAAGPAAGYNGYAHAFAGMLCMFLLFIAQDLAKSLIIARREGVLLRARVSHAAGWQILASLGLATTIIALGVSVLMYALAIVAFDVEILGPPLGFGAVIVAEALFVGGFALLLAGVGRTEKQVNSIGTALILGLSFAGGAWFPSFLMPEWLQSVGRALPTTWATDGLAAMTWRGLELGDGLIAAAAVAGFAALCAAIGIRTFRWS